MARYDALSDDFSLTPVAAGRFRTLVMAHVLEHFQDAAAVLRKLLAACARLGIERVVIVVPGERGFRSDPTHRTFVNGAYLQRHGLLEPEGWTLAARYGFPLNVEWLGELFVYHELTLVYDRRPVQR